MPEIEKEVSYKEKRRPRETHKVSKSEESVIDRCESVRKSE